MNKQLKILGFTFVVCLSTVNNAGATDYRDEVKKQCAAITAGTYCPPIDDVANPICYAMARASEACTAATMTPAESVDFIFKSIDDTAKFVTPTSTPDAQCIPAFANGQQVGTVCLETKASVVKIPSSPLFQFVAEAHSRGPRPSEVNTKTQSAPANNTYFPSANISVRCAPPRLATDSRDPVPAVGAGVNTAVTSGFVDAKRSQLNCTATAITAGNSVAYSYVLNY